MFGCQRCAVDGGLRRGFRSPQVRREGVAAREGPGWFERNGWNRLSAHPERCGLLGRLLAAWDRRNDRLIAIAARLTRAVAGADPP
ncbi:MAG: hypothetical protein D6798_05425 [Deltaproteobacteria bacterium]|nr:MAG: hypothetical protein D6798_05425 [Deltaproteobacteria bacterium]